MQNITLTSSTRECNNPNVFLGYEGENNANKLVFEFTDGFVDGLGQLYIKRGTDNGYVTLDKVGETYEFPVRSSVLSQIGNVDMQEVITKTDGTIIKYNVFTMVVKDAIDTDSELPEEYPSWQEAIAEMLAQTQEAIEKAESVSNQLLEDKENGVFDGKDGVDGISPTAKVVQTAEGAEVTITDAQGTTSATIKHGKDGTDGADGISSEISVKTSTETEYVLTIKDKNGSFDTPNLKGKDSEGGITNETDPIYTAEKATLALKTEIPTKTSELTNDSSFATETFVTNKIAEAELSSGDVDLSGYATKDELNSKADLEDIPTKVSELDNDSGYITGYTETDPTVPSHVKAITQANITNWNNKSNFSGNYNDLENKPDIPSIEGLATSEELTQGLATKQDTLVAGNNITIENGVISASGSGSGGITEIPIATENTLGGIKVGEGLEVSEDGILSTLATRGEVTLLAEPNDLISFTKGSSGQDINKEYTLNDSLENYDLLLVEWGTDMIATINPIVCSTQTIINSQYSRQFVQLSGNANDFTRTIEIHLVFTSANKLNFVYVRSQFKSTVIIQRVYGIKLGGGSGLAELPIATTDTLGGIKVGEGLEVTEDGVLNALSNKRAITPLFDTGARNLDTPYTLKDSIENYDLILLVFGMSDDGILLYAQGSYLTTPEICKVGSITYGGFRQDNPTNAGWTIELNFNSLTEFTITRQLYNNTWYTTGKPSVGAIYGIKL